MCIITLRPTREFATIGRVLTSPQAGCGVWSGSGSPNLRDSGEPEAVQQGSIKSVFHSEDVLNFLNHYGFTATVSCQLPTCAERLGALRGCSKPCALCSAPRSWWWSFLPWRLAMLSFALGWQHIGIQCFMCSEGDVADGCATAGLWPFSAWASRDLVPLFEVVHSTCFHWWARTPHAP